MTTKARTAKTQTTGTPRIEREDQSVNYIEHLATGTHTLRVRIHSNAYAAQSWGKVERWDGTRWHEVVATSGESLLVGRTTKLYVMPRHDITPTLFAADRARLLSLAGEVLV